MGWDAYGFWGSVVAKAKSASDKRAFPTSLQQVDVSADLVTAAGADVDYSDNPLKGIYVGDVAAGSIVSVTMVQDGGTFFTWDCVKGMLIPGVIVGVEGTVTTALKLVGVR
jgi:hypothetical protein